MLLLCAYCGVVQAQDYFIKTINITETSSDNGLAIIANQDGYVVMCGSMAYGTIGGTGIFKTDLVGNKIWENAFNFYPYDSGVRNLIQLPNNNYLISGGRSAEGLNSQDLYTIISSSGNIVRHVMHGDALDNRVPSSLFHNGKIVSVTNFGETNLNSHPLLVTMDTTCNLIIRQDTLEDVTDGYLFNNAVGIIPLSINEYTLGIIVSSEANKVYGYIRKIDTIGTTIWERKINNYASYQGGMQLKTLHNGNLVVSWYERQPEDELTSHIVRCYNPAGDSIWQYTLKSTNYIRNIQDLHICANGDIIGCGYTTNFELTGSPTCCIFRISEQGELVWLREYVYWDAEASAMLLYALTEDPYGDIIATGFAAGPNENGVLDAQAVLLKVNNMGCFGNGGCNDTTIVSSVVTGIEEASPQPPPKEGGHILPLEGGLEGGLWVYPNPTNDIVSVLTPQEWLPPKSILQIHDMAGRLVKTITVMPNNHGFSTFAVTDLPNGLYLLSLSSDGVRLAQAKMVVQH